MHSGCVVFKIHVSHGSWLYDKLYYRKKIKTLVKILGGRQHRTTPAGQIFGGRDPCNPCGVHAYVKRLVGVEFNAPLDTI